jgi:non-specific serine/threonine protein kinase
LFAPEQIALRLDDRFRLLTGGSRTAMPRQQTLRGAIDWSYGLLAAPERILFRRLSVFAGGLTFEAAEKVCPGDGLDEFNLDDVLGALVDKSLVTAEVGEKETRYRMLETMREYAIEKLKEASETQYARAKHREFFLAYAKETAAFPMAEKVTAYRRAEFEHDNLRAALNDALENGESEQALEFCIALADFWALRGFIVESRSWFKRSLDMARRHNYHLAGSRVQRTLFASLLVQDSNHALSLGDYGIGRVHCLEGLSILRELDDTAGISHALFNLGAHAWYQGDSDSAQKIWQELLAVAREIGNPERIATGLWILGVLARETGDRQSAVRLSEDALAIFRELDDSNGIGFVLENLACLALMEGDLQKSDALFAESLVFATKSGDEHLLAFWNNSRGYLALHYEDWSAARNHFNAALLWFHEMWSSSFVVMRCLAGVAMLNAATGQARRATKFLSAIERELERTGTLIADLSLAAQDRALCIVRSELSERDFNLAWQEGQAITIRQAMELALSDS